MHRHVLRTGKIKCLLLSAQVCLTKLTPDKRITKVTWKRQQNETVSVPELIRNVGTRSLRFIETNSDFMLIST